MGILDKLRDSLFGDPETSYTYQCLGCRTTFESTAQNAEGATCPECGGEDIRGVVGGQGGGLGQP